MAQDYRQFRKMELPRSPLTLEEKVRGFDASNKKGTTLVFLKEEDTKICKKDQLREIIRYKPPPYRRRLVQRAGFVRMRNDDPEWFHDQRYLPQQQAQYLKKLSQLREALITQKQNTARSSGGATVPAKADSQQRHPAPLNAFPERHKKLQRARKESIANARRAKTPPKISPLSGQQLLDSESAKLSRSMDNLNMDLESYPASEPPPLKLPYLTSPSLAFLSARTDLSYEALNDVIESQRSRLKEIQNVPLKKPSIPQAAHKPGTNNGFERGNTLHESFVRQIPMSKKNSRGICRGKTNVTSTQITGSQFMRADADELQFPVDFYDLALADSKCVGSQAPPTTPNVHKKASPRDAEYIRTLEEQRRIHIAFHGHGNDISGRDRPSDHCVFCDHERSEQRHLAEQNNGRNRKQEHHVTFDKAESETSSTKRRIVVDLPAMGRVDSASNDHSLSVPRLVVRAPSPQKHLHTSAEQQRQSPARLIKTFKQNELREKEVKNLLEDVKELNMVTENLAAES